MSIMGKASNGEAEQILKCASILKSAPAPCYGCDYTLTCVLALRKTFFTKLIERLKIGLKVEDIGIVYHVFCIMNTC